jgi:spermidine synthase
LIPFGLPYVGELYLASVGHGLPGVLLRGAVCAACLLPPTLLMGATLPAVARWVEATPRGVSWLGFFYGGNIAGAVFGCLLAGFYLLRVHDVATATYVAAAINGAVALIGLGLAGWTSHGEPARPAESVPVARAAGSRMAYVVIGLSGLCALSAEVIWTRLLSLMLGATVYTFSIILAVFLVGLGLGSAIGSLLARRARPALALGCCQLLLAAAIAWTALMLTESLPYWPINPYLSKSPWLSFQLDLVRCLWAVLPATVLWGASFPLALAAVASRGQDPGRLVGGVYAANTAGAIAGALGSSLFLIGWVGTQTAQRLLIGVSAAAAVLMFATLPFAPRRKAAPEDEVSRLLQWLVAGALIAVSVGLAGGLAHGVPELPGELVAWGRELPSRAGEAQVLYVGEGLNSSVAVTRRGSGTRDFHVSGKVEASTLPEDMRLQRMLGHMSALMHARPRKVLVVGCGAGVTAGAFLKHPDVERIVICEIEPLVPQVVAHYFGAENYDIVDGIAQKNPRSVNGKEVEVVYDDARHYVLTTQERFDIITSDPIHPWVKGAATLYTREYFDLCKQRLNPGGVVTQWVPLYESDVDTVKSEIATFFEAFPHGTVWSNSPDGEGYDIILLGQVEATPVDLDAFDGRLGRADHAEVVESLKDVNFHRPVDLLATYAGRADDLTPWLEGAEINRDRNLRLQYLAGLGLNHQYAKWIYRQMIGYRSFPEDLFVGSEQRKQALRWSLESPPE